MPMFIQRKPLPSSSKTATVKSGSPAPSGLRALGKQATRPKPVVKKEEPEPVTIDEPGTYKDYKIFSHDPEDMKFNGFRFNSEKKVSLPHMHRPVKLNRKDPLRKVEEAPYVGKLEPMMGPDGKPVIGSDGQVVMVDATGEASSSARSSQGCSGTSREREEEAIPEED